MKRWYVVQTKPREEFRALIELEKQSFKVYLPAYLTKHRKTKPYFPGYVFVEFDVGVDRWKSVSGTRGVKRLLSVTESQDKVFALPLGVVEELQRRLSSQIIEFETDAAALKYGEEVLITQGSFHGCSAKYLGHKDKIATVILTLLHAPARLKIPVEALQSFSTNSIVVR